MTIYCSCVFKNKKFGLQHDATNLFILEPNTATIRDATVTKTSMTVSWNQPSGGVGQYEVRLEEKSGSNQIIKSKSTIRATFNGLTPGTQYTVVLVTVYGGQRSTTPNKAFYTSKCVLINKRSILHKIGN